MPRFQPMPMTRTAAAAADLLAGVTAGLVAAWAMNVFQTGWMRLADKREPHETAASKTADAISEEVSGTPIKESKKKSADRVVHYLTAALIGGGYGLVGGLFPRLFTGAGLPFGAAIWLIADELVVPVLQLGPPPTKTQLDDQALSFSSHLIFGGVLELVRRQINGLVSPDPGEP
jgi:putative membrane protein